MVLTAELRLWWPRCPAEVERWWDQLPGVARTEGRTDVYLLDPDQAEIGIKARGGDSYGGAEVKQLVAKLGEYRGQPMELWVKSESPALSIAGLPTLAVHKSRRLRDYDSDGAPAKKGAGEDKACHVELAEVRLEGDEGNWWTLGLEASGTLRNVQATLERTLEALMPGLRDGIFASGVAASYPQWLSKVRNTG